eukprot:1204327-Prymnesium_polylepis.1
MLLAGLKPARQPQSPSASGARSPGHVALPASAPTASSASRSSTVKAPCVGAMRKMSYTPPPTYSMRAAADGAWD